jgi:hypothetical protein
MPPTSSSRPTRRAAIARLATSVAAAGVLAGVGVPVQPTTAGARPFLEIASWFPAPVCDGAICSTSSSDDLPRVEVRGRSFSTRGEVLVGFYRPQAADPERLYGAMTDSSGYFKVQTPQLDCTALPSTRAVAYEIQAVDLTTGTWSDVANVVLCGPTV